MARKERLIKPINNARFEDVVRALLQKKQPTAEKAPPAPKKNEAPASNNTNNKD